MEYCLIKSCNEEQVNTALTALVTLAQKAETPVDAFVFVIKGLLWLHTNRELFMSCPGTFHRHRNTLLSYLQDKEYIYETKRVEADILACTRRSHGLCRWSPKTCAEEDREKLEAFLCHLIRQQNRYTRFSTRVSLVMSFLEWLSQNTWLQSHHAELARTTSERITVLSASVPALSQVYAHLCQH